MYDKKILLSSLLLFTQFHCESDSSGSGATGAADAGATSPDECMAIPDIESQCGYLSVRWDIEDSALSCSQVAAQNVRVEIVPAGGSFRELSFDCAAGSGLSVALSAGPYSVRAHLVDNGGGILASTLARTVVLNGSEEVYSYEISFRLDDLGEHERYQDSCGEVGAAYCQRVTECGGSCETFGDFQRSCCDSQNMCDAISPLTKNEASSCAADFASVSCGLLDSAFFLDAADLDFCSSGPPPPLTAAKLGESCHSQMPCAAGYQCLTRSEFAEIGFCSIPCDGTGDTTTCVDGFPGPGAPACGIQVSGLHYCAVLCGQHNNGSLACPSVLQCEDGYDNDIVPDTCVTP